MAEIMDIKKSDNEIHDYDSIKKIAKRINSIKEKQHLISIINIIKTMNPNLSITENENGMFIKFNSLSPQTYEKLDNYIHNKIPKRQSDDSVPMSSSEYVPYSTDDICSISDNCKMSNREKTLIKKQKYSQSVS